MARKSPAGGLAALLAAFAAFSSNADQVTITCTRAIAKTFADTTFRVQVCENSFLRIWQPDHGPDMTFVFTPDGAAYQRSETGTANLAANAAVKEIRSFSTKEIRALFSDAEEVTKTP